jgi:hypothetical protein
VLGFKHIRATHKHSSWQMAYKNAWTLMHSTICKEKFLLVPKFE